MVLFHVINNSIASSFVWNDQLKTDEIERACSAHERVHTVLEGNTPFRKSTYGWNIKMDLGNKM